jgi:anti-repressor protein
VKDLERSFEFRGQRIRTVRIDGEPWFAAVDVCRVLGLDPSLSVTGRRSKNYADGLDADEKGTAVFSTLGGRQKLLIVSEPGLYSLIMRSHKPAARSFQRWLTHEVLPALRQTGGYHLPAAGPSGQLVRFSRRDLLQMAMAAEDECEQLRGAVAELLPKADFYDRVADTSVTFSLGETAKMLAIPGFGRNNLIQFLRDEGILMADNVAKQRYVDRGYFRIVQRDYYGPDGELRVKAVTRVYEKGVDYIRHRLDSYLQQYMERANLGR